MESRTNFPIERNGINHIRTIIENSNCRYTEFVKDNDFGVDALIEILYENETTGKILAIQIKSGKSYCNKTHCWIKTTEKHKAYWKKYPLPVFGIVYDPSEKRAYWANISETLKNINNLNTIKFVKSIFTTFNENSFKKFIRPQSSKEKKLSFFKSVKLAKTNDPIGIHIGMGSLLKNYNNRKETWEIVLQYFKNAGSKEIPGGMIYYLSTIPGHHGLWPGKIPTDENMRKEILEKFLLFKKNDIIKLLYPIDEYAEESGEFFPRGNTAHCAAVIIDQIPNKNNILKSIVLDTRQNKKVRKYALLILAMNLQNGILPILNHKSLQDKKFQLVREYLNEWLKDQPRYELFSQW